MHFPGEEPEPTPISELWDASEQAARWIGGERSGPAAPSRRCSRTPARVSPRCSARGGPAARSRRSRCRRGGCSPRGLRRPAHALLRGRRRADALARSGARTRCSTTRRSRCTRSTRRWRAVLRSSFDAEAGALVQFTSGSVGTPKGIYLTLDAVGAHVPRDHRRRSSPAPGDGFCSWLPLSHDMGLIGQLLSPLGRGRPPIRSSLSHAHEARDVHGQPAVVAADVLGDGGDDHRRARTSRWSSRSAPAAASDRSTCRGCGRSSSARSRCAPTRSSGSPTRSRRRDSDRSRSAPRTAWRKRRSRSRSCARTSRGARSRGRPIRPRRESRPGRSCPPAPPSTASTCG